ncbi:MAG: Permease [Candidatus Roizmanbacteria bacterium GW2011_GWC2_37_13]|uniref:Permease n=1 Tax=Candidatus Roizmanbacteria bacterium GW2011_GWC2_37_13 TaxID=1618486 RepID=A0A0G0G955_9BACT|nr:MAG: Permease [Candidatus Roizmanbacteria bacterium GW2011_GWC1_37_12]KKQ26547.1 MAG: Permease [Candidatus Roizmanbacteria bacterium GW2011_GWC2_37_13]
MNTNKGFLSLLSCGLILALFGLLVRLLHNFIGNFTQVGMRMLLAGLIVLPYLFIKKIPLKIDKQKPRLFSILVISFPLYILFFTVSINATKIANSFFYLFTSTMLTSYVLGYFYFKEKMDFQKILVAILSITGLLLFMIPSIDSGLIGPVTGIIGGFLYGISNTTRKYYVDKINKWVIIFYQMIIGALLILPIAYFLNEFGTNNWIFPSILLITIFGLGLVLIQILLFVGLSNFRLNLGSIVLASQLIFVLLIAIFVFKEIPTLLEVLGAFFIGISVFLSNIQIKNSTLKVFK